MKQRIMIIAMLLSGFLHQAAAQNNPVFFGGTGDGTATGSYLQMTSDIAINHGGSGDGFAAAAYAQNIVFTARGGAGDGFSLSSSGMPAIDKLFFGGVADGVAGASSGSPAIDMLFWGGSQDGSALAASGTSLADRIFYGGKGDGWASTYLPLSPLPLTLLSFSGEHAGPANLLRWRTAVEIRTAFFILERAATTGNFNGMGRVEAAGTASSEKNYAFADAEPLAGNNFYRLKMVDADGKYAYSNIVLLRRLKQDAVLKIYPNPSASVLNIELSGKPDGQEVLIDIYDASASLVTRKTVRKDNSVFQVNVQNLSQGVYSIRIIDQEEISVVKFIKN